MDCSFTSTRILLDDLIDLRKEAPREISDTYAKRNRKILKRLKNIKIDLHRNTELVDYNVTADNPFENINIKQDMRLSEKVYSQIQLLQILNKKKNCSISKIIDDI